MWVRFVLLVFFFFNDTATTEIYTLSLHDALPICRIAGRPDHQDGVRARGLDRGRRRGRHRPVRARSEEHTSELQSRLHLVCRLLLEKKKKTTQRSEVTAGSQPRTVPPTIPPSMTA